MFARSRIAETIRRVFFLSLELIGWQWGWAKEMEMEMEIGPGGWTIEGMFLSHKISHVGDDFLFLFLSRGGKRPPFLDSQKDRGEGREGKG